MNGLEAMIGIRNEFPEARIIVLTTYTGDVPGSARHAGRCSRLPAKKSVG